MTHPVERIVGSFTPLVTPFRDGQIDEQGYRDLVNFQIDEGSHGIVVAGTTGEPSALTLQERAHLLEAALDEAAGRVPVMAATGSQSLAETLWLTEHASEAGADALLVVTPYYIKPPQRGLVAYFSAVAERSELPFLIYHIPGRAAVSLEVATLEQIRERVPSLIGIKHAVDDLGFVSTCLQHLGDDFKVFVGLEELSLPMLAVGACGLVNAVGNLVPSGVAKLYEAVASGDLDEARQRHRSLLELNRAVFWDSNPIPIKYLMFRAGLLAKNEHRLPMMPPTDALARRLDEVWERLTEPVA